MDCMRWFLTSHRLGFRCWQQDDLPLALALWGDPRVSAMIGGPFTPQQIRARLAHEIAQMQQTGMQYWPIFLLDGGDFVGCTGLRPKYPRTFELGFHLLPDHWGKGLASEAARAVIGYGFGTLHAEALFAGHQPANATSKHILLKLGFEPAGEEFYEPSGLIEPVLLLLQPTANS